MSKKLFEEFKNDLNIDDELESYFLSENEYDDIKEEYGVDIKELEKEFENYSPKRDLEYAKTINDAVDPKYAYESDSGFDLYSTIEYELPAFGRALIPTGLKFNIPEGFEIQVRPKSGLAINQGLTVLNTPGTVDCFSEDMKILTIEGEKLISEIKIGDIVFSFNESTFEIEKDTITHIFNTEEQEILQIETEYGILEVTSNSEIYTKKGIILAKNLTETDEIVNFF